MDHRQNPDLQAVRVALQVKKFFVDKGILNVPIDAFEKVLFFHLLDQGFSKLHLQRYLRVSEFVSQRVPLVVLLAGPPSQLHRMLAQALASRLNMQNVQQSDLMYHIITSREPPTLPLLSKCILHGSRQQCVADRAALYKYRQECVLVRRAFDGDLSKTLRSGKSVVLDGLHVDPGMYMWEFGLLDAIEAAKARSLRDGYRDADVHAKLSPGKNTCTAAGVMAAVGQMGPAANDVCMMLRSRSHTEMYKDSDAENVALLRRHFELYTGAVEAGLECNVIPHSTQVPVMSPLRGTVGEIARSPGNGMSVHERMKHWWSTRACADSEYMLDDSASNVHSIRGHQRCPGGHHRGRLAGISHLHAQAGIFQDDTQVLYIDKEQPHASCVAEAVNHTATSVWEQVPNILTQVERARQAVTELQEHHKSGNGILDEIYSDQSHTQELIRPLPLFVPLVVLPHVCDKPAAHVNRPEYMGVDVDGAYLGQDCARAFGMRPGSECHQTASSRKSCHQQHQEYEDEMTAKLSDAHSHSFGHIEELLRAYSSCGTLSKITSHRHSILMYEVPSV